METKKCTKCKKEHEIIVFAKNKNTKDGYGSHCDICRKKYRDARKDEIAKKSKEYNTKNKEIIKEKRKRYLIKSAEKRNEKRRENYRKNNDSILEYQRKVYREKNGIEKVRRSRKKNKDKYREYARKWSAKNKEKIKQKHLYKMQNDSLYASKIRIRGLIKNSINHKGFKKGSKAISILGCDYEFFRNYIEAQFKHGMNWGNIHIDHIFPMSKAKTKEEVIILNHYTNFQPLFIKDNLSKKDKLITKQLRLL